MRYKVTIEKPPGTESIHLFTTEEEACKFVTWIRNISTDLDIKFNELLNDERNYTDPESSVSI